MPKAGSRSSLQDRINPAMYILFVPAFFPGYIDDNCYEFFYEIPSGTQSKNFFGVLNLMHVPVLESPLHKCSTKIDLLYCIITFYIKFYD